MFYLVDCRGADVMCVLYSVFRLNRVIVMCVLLCS